MPLLTPLAHTEEARKKTPWGEPLCHPTSSPLRRDRWACRRRRPQRARDGWCSRDVLHIRYRSDSTSKQPTKEQPTKDTPASNFVLNTKSTHKQLNSFHTVVMQLSVIPALPQLTCCNVSKPNSQTSFPVCGVRVIHSSHCSFIAFSSLHALLCFVRWGSLIDLVLQGFFKIFFAVFFAALALTELRFAAALSSFFAW